MKSIKILLALSISLCVFSCKPTVNDYSNAKTYQNDFSNLTNKIKASVDSLSDEDRLNIVFNEYLSLYPERYDSMKGYHPAKLKRTLIADSDFISICDKWDVDPFKFSPYFVTDETSYSISDMNEKTKE